MKKIVVLVMLICSLTFVGNSFADVTFSLSPANQAIGIGGTASLDLNVSGLTDVGPDSLGAFALDVNYNDSILSFNAITFNNLLGDIANFEADASFDDSTSGTVYLDEISWLFDWELDALQGTSFTLATLEFSGISAGTGGIDLAEISASDAMGFDLTVSTCENATVQVNAVPIPSSILLLGTGLFGLLRFRRKIWNA